MMHYTHVAGASTAVSLVVLDAGTPHAGKHLPISGAKGNPAVWRLQSPAAMPSCVVRFVRSPGAARTLAVSRFPVAAAASTHVAQWLPAHAAALLRAEARLPIPEAAASRRRPY